MKMFENEVIPAHYITDTIKKEQVCEMQGIPIKKLYEKVYKNKELHREYHVYNSYDIETIKQYTMNTIHICLYAKKINCFNGYVTINKWMNK